MKVDHDKLKMDTVSPKATTQNKTKQNKVHKTTKEIKMES